MANEAKMARYQIRIASKEPVELTDTEEHFQTWHWVLNRCRGQVRKTSYMVKGPNREVLWSIERWSHKQHGWVSVMQGKTRLREGAGPS